MVVERSNDRESKYTSDITANALMPMHVGDSTHPDYAALVDPLFASRKEGEKIS